jgi:hypothetical protein
MNKRSVVLTVALICLVAAALQAHIINVPADSSTIQSGINGAANGDTVMIAPGTYYEFEIDFLGKDIVVMGTDPDDFSIVESTVVDGDSLGSVFWFVSGEDSTSVLAGLTIRGGFADKGGGIFCEESSPTISRNIITENVVLSAGGGMIIRNNADATIVDNIITDNEAGISGGGIRCENSTSILIKNNLITNNWAGSHGGGISTHIANPTIIINNTITDNTVDFVNGGGGLTCTYSPFVTNCIIWNNSPRQISGDPRITYTDIEGYMVGEGNIDEDPLFVDPVTNDYHLQQDPPQPGVINPCVDTGDPSSSMIIGTTRTDSIMDFGIVDMGYHYPIEITGNLPPSALFDWTPANPEPGDTVYFDASASYDLDGTLVLYEWDWESDGTYDESASEPTASHVWTLPDTYTVTLRVTDNDSAQGTQTETVMVFSQTIYVPDDYPTIQDAIDIARGGDAVVVRPGTYVENIDFLGKGITVRSETGPDSTIIDGNQAGSVVIFGTTEGPESILQGFTIRNGQASNGGGIYCNGSSPTITENIIRSNSVSVSGGGIYNNESSPTISANVITENSAVAGGGGLFFTACDSSTITDNVISENVSMEPEAGGGISLYRSTLIIDNCVIDNNVFAGISCFCCNPSDPFSTIILVNSSVTGNIGSGIAGCNLHTEITNCVISDNTWNGLYSYVYTWSTTNSSRGNRIENTIISDNEGTGLVGGGNWFGTSFNLINSILVGNGSGSCGGVEVLWSGVYFTNSIVWGNSGYQACGWGDEDGGSNLTFEYSDVQDGLGGVYEDGWGRLYWLDGMIEEDPLFFNPDHGAYQLVLSSPCIDTGDPSIPDACLPPGRDGPRSDMGVYGGANNDGWLENSIDLLLFPQDSLSIPAGGTLSFTSIIWNSTNNAISGDYWLSVILPNLNEIIIPERFLNHSNPLSRQISPHKSANFISEVMIPGGAPPGSYSLIGRIGNYPDRVIDEEVFDFEVVE